MFIVFLQTESFLGTLFVDSQCIRRGIAGKLASIEAWQYF
jgi:hypothetical protein